MYADMELNKENAEMVAERERGRRKYNPNNIHDISNAIYIHGLLFSYIYGSDTSYFHFDYSSMFF